MSEVHEVGFAYDTPPTPFTMRYADSPRPDDEAERLQPTWTDIDSLSWVDMMHQQQNIQQHQQPQPQPQQAEQGDAVRWNSEGTSAIAHSQMLREHPTRQEDVSRRCSADPAGMPACVEFRHVHPLVASAAMSRENSGALGCAAFHAKAQRLHHGPHQAAVPSWSPPTQRNPSFTPPPPWVQPRLSATPHKVGTTARHRPAGRRFSVGTFVGPVCCAGIPFHALPPGQPNDSQVFRRQHMEAWPLAPATAADIQAWQASGSAAFHGQGMRSQATAHGQRSFGHLQGQVQVPAGGAHMLSPRRGITSKADFVESSPVPSSPGATHPMEAPCDELVRGRVAALCTPALSSRRVRSCCSPCLCDLEVSLARRAEPAPQ